MKIVLLFLYLSEFWQAEFSPVVRAGRRSRFKFLIHPHILGVLDGQVEHVFLRALGGALDVNSAVDANTRVDISQFRDSGQETTAVLVDILLTSLPVPFAVTTASAAGNSQTCRN